MKRFLKILLYLFLSLILLISILVGYIVLSGPSLPEETNAIIEEVKSNPLPQLIKGDSGSVYNNGVRIWYEKLSPTDSVKSTILLIMGISSDALAWPEHFFEPLVDSGYQVIRYDNRGTGLSDWMENWTKSNPYDIGDMAEDGLEILNRLNIDKAHIIGVSMGGMIAQEMAIHYPERVNSLISMLSSGHIEDPDLPSISTSAMKSFIRNGIKYGIISSEKNMIKLHLEVRNFLKGSIDYPTDTRGVAEEVLYNLRYRKGYNLNAANQQAYAISMGGSRYKGLQKITIPSLIIHGTDDPLIHISHGKKVARMITHADTLWIQGMGHDIPPVFSDQALSGIFQFLDNQPN